MIIPNTDPEPPYADTPPTTQAEIASISKLVPAVELADWNLAITTHAVTVVRTAMLR